MNVGDFVARIPDLGYRDCESGGINRRSALLQTLQFAPQQCKPSTHPLSDLGAVLEYPTGRVPPETVPERCARHRPYDR